MELGLGGKTAIVTGASAGIGLACAKELYREGVNVVMVARNEERLRKAIDDLVRTVSPSTQARLIAVSGDMKEADTVVRAVETAIHEFSRVDILINSAGSARAGSFLELSDEAYLEGYSLKFLGAVRMIKAAAPYMMEQQDGRIVNIIGGAGRTPSPTFLPGATTNAALLNFTRGISKELAKYRVRINAISPGSTNTERVQRLAEQTAEAKGISVEQQRAEVLKSMPLGRLVEPEEIASMALMLVSDRMSSMTGAEILIDAGHQPGV